MKPQILTWLGLLLGVGRLWADDVVLQSASVQDRRCSFVFNTQSNATYSLQYATTLAPPDWTTISTFTGSNGPVAFADTAEIGQARFYRVVQSGGFTIQPRQTFDAGKVSRLSAESANDRAPEAAMPAQQPSMVDFGFHPVDLTRDYNKPAGFWPKGTCWAEVPWGHNTYDGVPFEFGGIMELTGMDAARHIGEVFAGRHTGIPVGSAGAWIHLVHGVGWKEADGVPIARLTLHYQNGQTSDLVIRYGVHVRNWWKEPSESDSSLADANSKVIWSAPNPEPVGRPITLRLYKSSLQNAHPRWVISTLDAESLFTHATPVVVAVTVGGAGQGVRPVPLAPTPLAGRMTARIAVKAADTGKAVSDALLQMVLSDGERNYRFGAQVTDTAGRSVLECSREQVRWLSLSVSAPGYTTLELTRNILDLPPELDLKLEAQPH